MTGETAEQGYRGPQVCKVVGITYRQLDHWDRTGLISPSLASARGSGTQRLYSYRDVVVLRIIKQLLDSGVTLQRARRAIDFFRDSVGEDLAAASLVIGASDSVLARDGEELLDLLRGGQGVFNVIGLSAVVSDVDTGIHQLGFEVPEGTGLGAGESATGSRPGGSVTSSGEPSPAVEQAARAR
ncbi:MAG: MerR family transcriptional regulator [Acidimicrobiales bacterium]|jgi:DNA-binding transcriptional MerR regulator